MLKFAANISTLFTEFPFIERFREAKNNGFEYVEAQFPYEYDPKVLEREKAGLQCVLINSYCGTKDFGLASLPSKEVEFLNDLHQITPYYNALNVKKVHLMSGLKSKKFNFEDQLVTIKENLNSAVEYLENQNLIGLIEPICAEVVENYFLSDFETALEIINYVDSPHLKLLLDVFHLYKITGDVESNLKKYYPYAGHIQVSQDPGRKHPFFPGGNIDYNFVFNYLLEQKHQDVIGLEYFSSGSTKESLHWMKKYM